MPQLFTRSSKRRAPLLPVPARMTRSKLTIEANQNLDDSKTRSKKTPKTPKQSKRSRPYATNRRTHSAASEDGDDSRVGDGDGGTTPEEEDASDADCEEPAVNAPFYRTTILGTGHQNLGSAPDVLSSKGQDPNMIDSDDDDYHGVDEISDSDDELNEDVIESLELENIMFSEAQADPSSILNELDSGSMLGFPYDFAGFSESADSASEPVAQRHVHFGAEIDQPRPLSQSLSPLLTRALLPSLQAAHDAAVHATPLTARHVSSWTSKHKIRHPVEQLPLAELTDSDATDEDLPAEAHTNPKALQHRAAEVSEAEDSPPTNHKVGKKASSRRRGPKRGTFTVDKNKPWAILDSTGKKMVFLPAPNTRRHEWLDEKVQQAYNASVNASPATSFAHLVDEASVTSSQDYQQSPMATANANVMMAGLNSDNNAGVESSHGHTTGPAEAFYPPPGYQLAGDYIIGPGDLDDNKSDASNEGDLPIKLDDLISWDDSDDSDEDSPSTRMIYMPPLSELSGSGNVNDQFSHLNNTNVTAFRRNADPARAASRSLSEMSGLAVTSPNFSTPPQGHKRKRSFPPYHGKKYDGVTPVQRRVIHALKRRKMTT